MSLLGFLKGLGRTSPKAKKGCFDREVQVNRKKYTLRSCRSGGYVEEPATKLEYTLFTKGGEKVGMLRAEAEASGFQIGWANVVSDRQNQRLGTRLYDAALRDSCKLDSNIVSDTKRSEFAEAFWRKQRAKGRARCLSRGDNVEEGGAYWEEPIADAEYRLSADEFEALMDRLPKPEVDTEYYGYESNKYWPCQQWGISDTCKTKTLGALPRVK